MIQEIHIQDKLANLAAQTEILWSMLKAIHDAMEGELWANAFGKRGGMFARWLPSDFLLFARCLPADYPLIISVTPLPFSCFKLVSKL